MPFISHLLKIITCPRVDIILKMTIIFLACVHARAQQTLMNKCHHVCYDVAAESQ